MTDKNSSPWRPLEAGADLPEVMNDPFNYQPHPLCRQAIAAVRPEIDALMRGEAVGKMFGVLIAVDGHGAGGFLVGYSGQIGGRSDWPGFVPAVYDYLQPDGYFKTHEADITAINREVERLAQQPERLHALEAVAQAKHEAAHTLETMRQEMFEARGRRRAIRAAGPLDREQEEALVRESQFQKAEYRRQKVHFEETIAALMAASEVFESPLRELKAERRRQSDELQRWLFGQFQMLNGHGERRHLLDIFRETSLGRPPSGAGECCEPRLLQYAYEHGLRPLQMAMFWVGPSPKVEIRHDGRFYPACRGKCLPILRWMLGDRLPAAHPQGGGGTVELPIVYEDDDLVVVNKPAGLLSVPGISEYYSVWSIMRHRYPDTDSPLTVHRLDQPTSGLLLVGKTRQAFRELQRQFMAREVKKRYVALLERGSQGVKETSSQDNTLQFTINTHHPSPNTQQGHCLDSLTPWLLDSLEKNIPPNSLRTISLPLYSDPLNRPYQSVDSERGKWALTHVEFLGDTNGHARVALYPQTGRTHQLRVHCAHPQGLGNPILGDNLYGSQEARRLFLHAESISFRHPRTGEAVTFSVPPDF